MKLLAEKWGHPVTERRSIDELISAHESENSRRSLVRERQPSFRRWEIYYKGKTMTVGDGKVGKWSQKFLTPLPTSNMV
ncbi:MAG: hypothetical protein R2860_03965 [Desulfobacterales bacterium]